MNWKLTAGLVVVAAIVGVVVYINPFESEEEREPDSPWFYQLSFDDIIEIEVNVGDKTERFFKNDRDAWVFERLDGIPPSHTRWGGIVLLLSGPQTRRDFSAVRPTIDDPAEYGLDDPKMVVDIGLTGDRNLEFRMGDKTTDGDHSYGQVVGFPQLFLIAEIWGRVIARLADEPPYPKWYEYRDPETIEEVNVYLGVPGNEDSPYLRLQNEHEEGWFARSNWQPQEADRPLDMEEFAQYLPLIGGPRGMTVQEYRVRDRDYGDWGIDTEGHSIEIRFAGKTERGTKYTDGSLYLIGDKTEDGRSYYAAPASDLAASPVVLLEAEWVETLFGLVENVPYADEEPSDSG